MSRRTGSAATAETKPSDGSSDGRPPANATARAIAAGAGEALERGTLLLETAAKRGVTSDDGRAALRAARRVYLREARRLRGRIRTLAGSEADALEQVAVELLARALALDETPPPEAAAVADVDALTAVPIVVTPSPGDKKIDVTYSSVPLAVSYRITATELGATAPAASATKPATTPTTPATLGSLVNGRSYTVAVDALDNVGGVLGHGEVTATPGAPLTVTNPVPGDKKLDVSYAYTGTQSVNNYLVTATPAGGTTAAATVTNPSTTLTATLSNLVNGTSYVVVVEARDSTNGVIAQAQATGTPASPLSLQLVPGDRKITATYVVTGPIVPAPSSYRFSVQLAGATVGTPVTRQKTDPPTVELTGLTNGKTYLVTVEALDNTNKVLTSADAVATPVSPLEVTAIPGDKRITAVFTLRSAILPVPVKFRFTATNVVTAATAATVTINAGDAPTATLLNLTNGTAYLVLVEALDGTNGVITSADTTATPVGTVPLAISPLDLHPLTVSRPDVARLRRSLAEAARVGSTWRFDYLRAQALAAAEHASEFERQIADLWALDVAKATGAEQVLTSYLLGVSANLEALLAKVEQLPKPDVAAPAEDLAGAINTYVLLERLLEWLARNDALQFWVGLFGKVIDDLAAFDTKLTRTRRYVREQLASTAVGDAVAALADEARAEVAAMVDELAAPLRASVGDAVAATAAGMQAVFDSFDEPLLVNAGAADAPGVATGNPLGSLTNQLLKAVDELVAEIKADVERQLDLAANPAGAADLFEAIVITYVVLPILAALVVALAGGPLSAALLAAAVTLAAQELLHLLAQWLHGPLLGQLESVRARVDETIEAIRAKLAADLPASLGATTDPAAETRMLAGQLGSLAALVPKVFLDDAAAVLGDARDAVLRSATNLALAAEQALGLEAGTAFDEIALEYVTDLAPAPQLPGGVAAGREATAALVRDLTRLDQARVELLDGKELETTLRLSLFRELGGAGDPAKSTDPSFVAGELARLLRGDEVAVRLREEALLDRTHPGLYRVLIAEICALGVFDKTPSGDLATINVPVHVTHLGESRTRIRKDATFLPIQNQEKWGASYLEQDRDPTAAALGFVTLVRLQEPETTVFNLFPGDASMLATTTAGGVGGDAAPPPRAQYRPLENRGLEGTLLLRLPTAGSVPAVLGQATPTLVGTVGPHLVDVVLDVTVRACYDPDLAAAVRASREQRASALELASAAVGGASSLALAPRLPQPEQSSRRTVHFSLRGHRDETLELWRSILGPYSAAHAGLPTGGADWNKVGSTAQLGVAEAFKPLPLLPPGTPATPMPKFTIAFAPAVATPTVAAGSEGPKLAGLADKLVVTPETLGVAADLATATASGAGLVGMSVSIVPTQAGASTLSIGSRGTPVPWAPGGAVDVAVAETGGELQVGVVGGTAKKLFWTARRVLGWDAFSQPVPTHPNPIAAIAMATVGGKLNACAVDGATREVLHATKSAAAWSSSWQPVNPGTVTGGFSAVAAAEVAGELQVCAVDRGSPPTLWHALQKASGAWTGFGNVFGVAGSLPGSVIDCDCVELDGELWVFATTSGPNMWMRGHWYAVRHANGAWERWRQLSQGPFFTAVGAANVGGEINLVLAFQGDLSRSRRRTNGTWDGESITSKAGKPGTFVTAKCAEVGNELAVCGITTDGKVWLTTRHADGTWDPFADVALEADKVLKVDDPLSKLTLEAKGALATLLPDFTTAKAPAGRLTISPFEPGAEPVVDLPKLFDTAKPAALELKLDPVSKGLVYDVLFSLTFSVPVQTVTPST